MNDFQLYSAAACRDIDALAMAPVAEGGMGLTGQALMQRAAQFALDTLLLLCPQISAISILCGKGNNAGDGYLVGLLAKQLGVEVQIIAVSPTQQLTGDAFEACERVKSLGLVVEKAGTPIRHSTVVDALLGTGSVGAPRPNFAAAIVAINSREGFVLSLDLPSGLNADNGEAFVAVHADATVSFIARKIGLYTGKGPGLCGERLFSDLGVPEKLAKRFDSLSLRWWQSGLLPELAVDSYKHQLGHVLIVGGCKGMGGAVVLAAEAALRSGAGLVTVATDPANLPGLLARLPEAMWVDPLSSDDTRSMQAALSRASVVVLGPGLGRSAWAGRVLEVVASYNGPLVIDADGLYWLANQDQRPVLKTMASPLFLTPHAGEAARLLNRTVDEVVNQPRQSVIDMSRAHNATCLLKGPGTMMGNQHVQTICGHGNPGMATAGMGDVLAGLVGSFIAQQPNDSESAFCAAVLLHSAAADRAALDTTERGIIASSTIPYIASLLREEESV